MQKLKFKLNKERLSDHNYSVLSERTFKIPGAKDPMGFSEEDGEMVIELSRVQACAFFRDQFPERYKLVSPSKVTLNIARGFIRSEIEFLSDQGEKEAAVEEAKKLEAAKKLSTLDDEAADIAKEFETKELSVLKDIAREKNLSFPGNAGKVKMVEILTLDVLESKEK